MAHQIFFICNVLSRLFYKLFLKLIKYDGNIVNNIKINENIFGNIYDESVLMKI
jgi:hypothetical protein